MSLAYVIPLILVSYYGVFLVFSGLIGLMGMGSFRKTKYGLSSNEALHHFYIVIPAHNEGALLARTLESVLNVDYDKSKFRVLVLADNCNDRTVAIASKFQVEVLERKDPEFQGKGYAIHEALSHLLEDSVRPCDAFVILDADSIVDKKMLRAFDRGLNEGKRWMQAMNRGLNVNDSWRCGALDFAMTLINGVWLAGINALGVSCSLRGNGMCLSRAGVTKFPWLQNGLVEDLEYSWNLRMAGEHITFEPDAVVYAEMVPDGGARAVSQRSRWESGRQSMKKQFVLPLLKSPLKVFPKMIMLFDLFMLPLSRLLGGFVSSLGLWAVVVYLTHGLGASLLIFSVGLGLGLSCLGGYVLSPFILKLIPLARTRCLLYAPRYFLWKCRLYFYDKPVEWIRTPRA